MRESSSLTRFLFRMSWN